MIQIAQTPPQAVNVEKTVLASFLTYPDAIYRHIEQIKSSDFYNPQHASIMEAIEGLFARSMPIDTLTVSEELKRSNKGDSEHLEAFLSELLETMGVIINLKSYIGILVEKSMRRKIIVASSKIISECYSDGSDAEACDIISDLEGALYNIAETQEESKFEHISKIATRSLELIHNAHVNGVTPGITTGFSLLDKYTGGHHKSDLTVIGGRPGMGKTSLALDFGLNAKCPVAIFSLEMNKIQLANRLLSRIASVSGFKLRNGKLTDQEMASVKVGINKLFNEKIHVNDTPNLNMVTARSRLRRLIRRYKIELVVVDYLQLMQSTNKKHTTVDRVSENSRGWKLLAKEFDIPIILLSQLSRNIESRPAKNGGRRPQLSDLRDSGTIEQDADNVFFIYREEAYLPRQDSHPDGANDGDAEIIIAKQREGQSDIFVPIKFQKSTTHFYDREETF